MFDYEFCEESLYCSQWKVKFLSTSLHFELYIIFSIGYSFNIFKAFFLRESMVVSELSNKIQLLIEYRNLMSSIMRQLSVLKSQSSILFIKFMNNNQIRKFEKQVGHKIQNLSQLSISQIWDNKFLDESSDFQQQRYLINTIDEKQKQLEHEYGLQFQRKDSKKYVTKNMNAYQLRPNDDPQDIKENSETHSSLDKNNVLAFNKQKKRKRSISKQRNHYQVRSAKLLFSTKPVPNIQQHAFKSIKQQKFLKSLKFPSKQQLKPARSVIIHQKQAPIRNPCKVDKNKNSNNNDSNYKSLTLQTTLYEIPIRHPKFKIDSNVHGKLYHQMNDQNKIEINDFNSQFIENMLPISKEDNCAIKESVYHETDQTVKNYWPYKRTIPEQSVKSSQITYFNEGNTQNSWVVSSVGDKKIFELKRPKSFDNRNQSIFSSSKTDRQGQLSPFSRDSSRTTRRIDNFKLGPSPKNLQCKEVESFYRTNKDKHCLEYFVNGCTQQTLKSVPYSS